MSETSGSKSDTSASCSENTDDILESFEHEEDDVLEDQPKGGSFTSLNQMEADMSLARILQEQERRAFFYSLNSQEDNFRPYFRFDPSYSSLSSSRESYTTSLDSHSIDNLENFSENENSNTDEIPDKEMNKSDSSQSNPGLEEQYESDEAFARALQEAEDRETTIRILSLAGLNIQDEELENNSEEDSQDFWLEEGEEEEMSYEELLALGEIVGAESKGLTSNALSKLKRSNYLVRNAEDSDQCVICRVEMEEGDECINLPCNHFYHSECISQWFKANKVCPICNFEVPSSSTH